MKTVFFIFLCVLIGLTEIWSGWDNLLMTSERFRNCPSNTTYPNPFTDIAMAYGGEDGSMIVNGNLKVTDKVGKGARLHIDAIKCLVASDEASCSFFHRFELDFCTYCFSNPHLSPWVRAIKNFGPCPILPGVYPVVDLELNFSNPGPWRALTNPEQYIGHWKLHLEFLTGSVMETCCEIEGDIKKKRRKSKNAGLPFLGLN